jgi:hypothetical protein
VRQTIVKKIKNRLIVALAIIGVCAVAYGGWHVYQQKVAEKQAQQFFGAPPTSPGMSELYHGHAPPPPQ